MGKAIAIPYVIALILGVAVIALLGVWFAVTGGKFSGGAQETYCNGKITEGCTKFINNPALDTPDDVGYPLECQTSHSFTFNAVNCRPRLGLP